MLTRRALFTRLSAAFLAPLVKWVPGRNVDAGLDLNATQLLTHHGWETVSNTPPHMLYFSKVHDPADWDFDEEIAFGPSIP